MNDEYFENSKTKHGTPAGCNLHRKLGEVPCAGCLEAKAAYDKKYRKNPEAWLRNRVRSTAAQYSYRDLRKRYPKEYKALYEKHLVEVEAKYREEYKEWQL